MASDETRRLDWSLPWTPSRRERLYLRGTASDTRAASQEGDVRILDGSGRDGSQNPAADRRDRSPMEGQSHVLSHTTRKPSRARVRVRWGGGGSRRFGSDRGDEADLGLPGVIFEVREWFSGGRGDTVTVDVEPPTRGSEDLAPGYAYGVGSRLLVSGEARWGGSPLKSPIAWGCGFSRYYDSETAMAWRDAFAR